MKHKNALMIGFAVVVLIGVTVVYSQQKASSGGAAGHAASAHTAGVSWSSTRKVEISDPQYQMIAYDFEVPSNWKFAGTIARPSGCHSTGAALKYTTQSPDGLTALVMLPGVTWAWNTSEQRRKFMEQSHCAAVDIDSAASFLVNIAIPNLHPGAKIVAVLPLQPEGQAALKQQLEQMRQQNASMAQQYHQAPQDLTLDGARVRIQYERDGQPTEEMVTSVVSCVGSKTAAMYAQPASEQRTCNSRSTVIIRAPQGHLDELLNLPQFKALGKTLQVNPVWQNRLSQDQQAAFQKFEAANNAQFQANMRANQAQFDQRIQQQKQFDANLRAGTDRAMAQDRARQDAIGASAHKTALYALDQQEFTNPTTGQTIQASSQYNHQWVSSDGSTLIQTNDHSYDPNGQVYPVSQSWTELVPK